MIALQRFSARMPACVSVPLIAAVAIDAAAQAASQKTGGNPGEPPSVTIQASVREVLVPVVVTDKEGHYITDLKASDFPSLRRWRSSKSRGI
jgi:hypothetical protein